MFRILLFAGLRDTMGTDWLSLPADNIVTAGDLVDQLKLHYPEMERWFTISRLAVNRSFVTLDVPIHPDNEIALIPPVSGG